MDNYRSKAPKNMSLVPPIDDRLSSSKMASNGSPVKKMTLKPNQQRLEDILSDMTESGVFTDRENRRYHEKLKKLYPDTKVPTPQYKLNKNLLRVGKYGIPLLGLLAPSADAAVLPYSDVAEDKAIEDPSSPEFKKRRSLMESLRGK